MLQKYLVYVYVNMYIYKEKQNLSPSERQTQLPQGNKLMKCELLYNVVFQRRVPGHTGIL